MHPITLLLAALAPLTAASPSPILSDRQGGSFVAVGNKYSAGGCTDQSLIFADPIFGNGNVCQPLNRNEPATPVVSYKTLSTTAGCSVTLYTTSDCTGTPFSAPIGGCVTGNAPFVSVFVTCV